MIPTAPLPQTQPVLPTQAATVTAAVNAERQTQKQLHTAVDSSQKDQRADNNKQKGDQKDSFSTQRAEGELGAVRRKGERNQQQAQQFQQQAKQAAPSPEKPSVSANLSYTDKIAALAGMHKAPRDYENATAEHLDTIEPHLARHGDGSVTAGLGLSSSRILSDLDELIGEDVLSDAPTLTTSEGSHLYTKINSMHDALAPTSSETDIQS